METFLILKFAMILCTLFFGVAVINIIDGVVRYVASRRKTTDRTRVLLPLHSK